MCECLLHFHTLCVEVTDTFDSGTIFFDFVKQDNVYAALTDNQAGEAASKS